MYVVGICRPGEPWRIVYRGWSRLYAFRVRRRWLKRGYTVNFEETQQEAD
jgi:hypothetical protein